MVEGDTVRLLRECDAGIKMGVSSIDEVLDKVESGRLKHCLQQCRDEHEKLRLQVQRRLHDYSDQGKDPNPFAKGMSWMKTNMMLGFKGDDSTVADLMTDGCNMGVKSLNRYLNLYKAADEHTKDITKKLIKLEEQLTAELRPYL